MIKLNEKDFIFQICKNIYWFMNFENKNNRYHSYSNLCNCIDVAEPIRNNFLWLRRSMEEYLRTKNEAEKASIIKEMEIVFKSLKNFYYDQEDLKQIEEIKASVKNCFDINEKKSIIMYYKQRLLKEEHQFVDGTMYVLADGTAIFIENK